MLQRRLNASRCARDSIRTERRTESRGGQEHGHEVKARAARRLFGLQLCTFLCLGIGRKITPVALQRASDSSARWPPPENKSVTRAGASGGWIRQRGASAGWVEDWGALRCLCPPVHCYRHQSDMSHSLAAQDCKLSSPE